MTVPVAAGAGTIVVATSLLVGAVATAAADPLAELLLVEYGPIGLAVFALWRRIDRLEDELEDVADDVDEHADDLDELPL